MAARIGYAASSPLDTVTTTNPSWVILARILRTQGRRGELLAEIMTDFPDSFAERKRLFLIPENLITENVGSGAVREVKLEAHWRHKGCIVLKFAGIDSISDAEKLRHFAVAVPYEERMPLKDGAVYVSDLIGAWLIDMSHGHAQEIGEITAVEPEGAGPAMLVVRTQAAEPLLIPFVNAYLTNIDLKARRVEMVLPEGLIAINAPLTAEERRQMREQIAEGK